MAHRSVEIANEFLRLAPGANLTQMQVQKLVYIAHGWNLVINGQPLVGEDVKAWPYGPVYPDLYEHTQFFGRAPIGRLITPDDAKVARFFGDGVSRAKPYESRLTTAERAVVEQVWRRYGNLSAIKLSELTHQPNTPWSKAYRTGGQGTPLAESDIVEHYSDLARRATVAANSAH